MTWQLPHEGANPWLIVSTIQNGGRAPIPAAADLPGPESGAWPRLPEYIALMQRCWAQSPLDRPTFREVVAALRELADAPGSP